MNRGRFLRVASPSTIISLLSRFNLVLISLLLLLLTRQEPPHIIIPTVKQVQQHRSISQPISTAPQRGIVRLSWKRPLIVSALGCCGVGGVGAGLAGTSGSGGGTDGGVVMDLEAAAMDLGLASARLVAGVALVSVVVPTAAIYSCQ
jgi:hypothetical protein